jgi:FixJ family two-component response regulator
MMALRKVVVVVDDDAGILKSVARLLACHGIESRTFASAEASSCSAGLRHRDRSGPSSS